MLKNPYLNALMAGGYIVVLVTAMSQVISLVKDKEETILIPMTMLSLFVFSASVMGLLFVYPPLKMFLEGRGSEALSFLFKTMGTFACLVLLFVVLLIIF